MMQLSLNARVEHKGRPGTVIGHFARDVWWVRLDRGAPTRSGVVAVLERDCTPAPVVAPVTAPTSMVVSHEEMAARGGRLVMVGHRRRGITHFR